MADPERAVPRLREAHRYATSADGKLRCAHVLGMLGDPAGVETLVARVRAATNLGDESIGYYFPYMTWLDSYILALGCTRDPRALPPILEKLKLVGASKNPRWSHVESITLALERIGDHSAAKPLAKQLRMMGGAKDATTSPGEAWRTLRTRRGRRQLVLARALYRCGDWQGLGRHVLEVYANDVRGQFARHARTVLASRALDG